MSGGSYIPKNGITGNLLLVPATSGWGLPKMRIFRHYLTSKPIVDSGEMNKRGPTTLINSD
jgi:hypothetical protein